MSEAESVRVVQGTPLIPHMPSLFGHTIRSHVIFYIQGPAEELDGVKMIITI